MSNYDKITIKDGKLCIYGALFANAERNSDVQPNAKSWDKDNGIGMAAWTKTSSKGTKYQSVAIDIDISKIPADVLNQLCGGAAPVQQPVQQAPANKLADEDVPF